MADISGQTEMSKNSNVKPTDKKSRKKKKDPNLVTIVDPSAILSFPAFMRPCQIEFDNSTHLLIWIEQVLYEHAQTFKHGVFNPRMKGAMSINTLFNMMIGSNLTSNKEKEVFRTGRAWSKYLETHFGVNGEMLSRTHSVLYAGVFTERVFRMFDPPLSAAEDAAYKWGLVWEDTDDVNDYVVCDRDWSIKLIPRAEAFERIRVAQCSRTKIQKQERFFREDIQKIRDLKDQVAGIIDDSPAEQPDPISKFWNIDRTVFSVIVWDALKDIDLQRVPTKYYDGHPPDLDDGFCELAAMLLRTPSWDEVFAQHIAKSTRIFLLDLMAGSLAKGEIPELPYGEYFYNSFYFPLARRVKNIALRNESPGISRLDKESPDTLDLREVAETAAETARQERFVQRIMDSQSIKLERLEKRRHRRCSRS